MSDARRPDRRTFLGIGLGAFAVAALPGVVRPDRRLVRRTVPAMGTVADFAVVSRREDHAQRAIDAAVAELRRVEALMTRFRDDSDVGRANLRGARAPVPVSSETAAVVREALRWSRASGGVFDPALGRLIRLWNPADGPEPGDAGRKALAGRSLWRAVEVETGGSVPRIRFHDPDVSLDLGGIAKGYGVDRAAAALEDHGAFDALVNVGGDLRVLGLSADRDRWTVGVRDPRDPARTVTTLRLTDAAVATSGDYLQEHHLLDPADGRPRTTGMRTLTVVARSCVDADAAATATFGMEPALGADVLTGAGVEARIAHFA